MWMWRFLPAVIFFFFSLFVSGGCGMGGGFWVGGWQYGAGDGRERQRRERKNKKLLKNNKETLFK